MDPTENHTRLLINKSEEFVADIKRRINDKLSQKLIHLFGIPLVYAQLYVDVKSHEVLLTYRLKDHEIATGTIIQTPLGQMLLEVPDPTSAVVPERIYRIALNNKLRLQIEALRWAELYCHVLSVVTLTQDHGA